MITLCPSPLNELGKGIFAPEDEADLLARGYIFASRVPGARFGLRVLCKRPIADAVTDANLDNRRTRTLTRQPV